MEAMLNDAISTINGYLWSYFIIFILIGAGLFFTMTTNFVQIRMIKEMIRLVINGAGSSTEKNHVSSFQAFCVSTASRVELRKYNVSSSQGRLTTQYVAILFRRKYDDSRMEWF